MRRVVSRRYQTFHPGCEKYAYDDDAYLRCQVRTEFITFSHPCGTAKMGDPNDASTVVDPKLRCLLKTITDSFIKKKKYLSFISASIIARYYVYIDSYSFRDIYIRHILGGSQTIRILFRRKVRLFLENLKSSERCAVSFILHMPIKT